MSVIASLLEHPVVLKLGWVLLHFLWQGAALAVIGMGRSRVGPAVRMASSLGRPRRRSRLV